MEAQIESAIAGLRPALEADGFALDLETVDAGVVRLALTAGPDACMECLLPDDVLLQILEQAIRAEVPDIRGVTLRRVNFGTEAQ